MNGRATAEDLADRVARIEALGEIEALSSRYALAVDERDYEGLHALFAPDATFGGTSDGAPPVSGVQDIVDMLRKRLEKEGPTYHYVHHVAIILDGPDQARGVATTHSDTRIDDRPVSRSVRYHDEYQRLDGAWRFRSRRLAFHLIGQGEPGRSG